LTVLVDEAYHEYVDDPGYSTMIPFALSERRVIVSRTFSKAYGMAGLRLGFAIARPETLERMEPHLVGSNVNQLAGAAGVASLKLSGYADRERQRNSEARSYAVQVLTDAGYQVVPPQANFLMVDIRRDSKEFLEACQARGVAVGRPFPPLTTHARISIGTLEEMREAMAIITSVLRT
jgi:histidinol-phosphate aminotransferase